LEATCLPPQPRRVVHPAPPFREAELRPTASLGSRRGKARSYTESSSPVGRRSQRLVLFSSQAALFRNSKSLSCVAVAQANRASLLASATVALLWPRRCEDSSAQDRTESGSRCCTAAASTARAPWISSMRKETSP